MMSVEERFWAKVEKTGRCWLWIGGTTRGGYGEIWVDGRNVRAPRFSWELAYGPIPKGKQVCHRCDNPPCVRPGHLFLGTQSDNTRDAFAKGRGVRPVLYGEAHGMAKLTRVAVEEMREQHKLGDFTYAELGRRYGVSKSTAWDVVRGSHWPSIREDA